jgi:hypothetical protein
VRLTFGFCDGYRPSRPGLHGPQCQHGRRPDLLSPCRGDLRLARAAFDRKPRLWPDCRFVAARAVGSRVLLRAAVDRKQKCGLAGAERVRWLGLRETGSERSVSQRSFARPDPGIASAGCGGVAVVAGHRLA